MRFGYKKSKKKNFLTLPLLYVTSTGDRNRNGT